MAELRRDYMLDRFVVVPDGNGKSNGLNNICPYCPGNERMTEPAVLVLVQKDGMLQRLSDDEGSFVSDWCVRVFPSREPAVSISENTAYSDKPFLSEPAYGYHYVVVATPDHGSLCKASVEHWANILVVVQDRVRWLYTKKGVSYVSVYMSHNSESMHPHLNMVTFSSIPPVIEQESNATHRYVNENGTCPLCNVIRLESRGPREVLSTDSFIAFCPWASSHPYEFWIAPKKHNTLFSKSTQKDISDLAFILRSTLGGLPKALQSDDFNLVFHISPEKKNSRQLHWHIEVYPKMSSLTGLEYGFGVHINRVKPEHAASTLGAAARAEFACLIGITS